MNNAIYCRVSTDAQAEMGYSISDQIRSCRAHAASLNLDIIEYIDDGYSGEFLERPALERLREDLRANLIHSVIVYDPDRLSRNLTNQLLLADEIEKANAQLIFITHDYDASPEGRLFFSIRGAISAFEKAKIRERTLRGKRSKALSGKLVFNDEIFGYRYDHEASMYLINPAEQEIIQLIFQLYTTRSYGINSLCSELKSRGILNRQGKPFSLSTLHYILNNETYAGIKWSFTTYEKTIGQKKRKKIARDPSEWISIPVPAIIDHTTWEKAAECRHINKVTAKRNTKSEYLLSNLIRCASCGYAMRAVNYHRGNKDYCYYVCTAYTNGNSCNMRKNLPSQELDDAVWSELIEVTKKRHAIAAHQFKDNANDVKIKVTLENQLTDLKKRQNTIVKWVADGTIEITSAENELHVINKELASTKNAIHSLTITSTTKEISSNEFIYAKDFSEKRRVIIQSGLTVFAKRENGKTAYFIRF